MTNLPALPKWFKPKEILAQYLEGKETEEIAAKLGINREKLVYHLTTKAPEDWKEAQLIRALKRYEEAETAIDDAEDMLKLSKAREKLKSSQWIMERVCRRIYGETKEPEAQQPVMINIDFGSRNKDSREPITVEQPAEAPIITVEPLPAPKPKPVFIEPAPQTLNYDNSGFV